MPETQRSLTVVLICVWIIVGILFAVAAGVHTFAGKTPQQAAFTFPTPYQAILLANGAVYFGHLQDYNTPHPILTDVYYIVTQTNDKTKQANNILVKRGKELHEPDRMYLSPNQIIFVEPVGPNSKVAQLIAQAKQQ